MCVCVRKRRKINKEKCAFLNSSSTKKRRCVGTSSAAEYVQHLKRATPTPNTATATWVFRKRLRLPETQQFSKKKRKKRKRGVWLFMARLKRGKKKRKHDQARAKTHMKWSQRNRQVLAICGELLLQITSVFCFFLSLLFIALNKIRFTRFSRAR